MRKIHQPLGLVEIMARIFGRFQSFPITTDQITMLLLGNVTDNDSCFKELAISPTSFYDGIREYINPSPR